MLDKCISIFHLQILNYRYASYLLVGLCFLLPLCNMQWHLIHGTKGFASQHCLILPEKL